MASVALLGVAASFPVAADRSFLPDASKRLIFAVTLRRMFETLSFLPPLDDDAIAKQVEYIIKNGWTPCLEFSEPEFAYVTATHTNHIRGTAFCNYMDNRCDPAVRTWASLLPHKSRANGQSYVTGTGPCTSCLCLAATTLARS